MRNDHSIHVVVSSLVLYAGLLAGCDHAAAPPAVVDVSQAQADAQKEVDDARVEAHKDMKNAVKQGGPDSRNAVAARVTGSFDVAMANADGEHKVALEKCLLLAPVAQQPCRDQADAQYESATASAKAARGAKIQGS